MFSYYDMHCHILPGVDDGSENMEMTKNMLHIAYENGIRCMVATPHFIPGADNATVKELQKMCRAVQAEAEKIGDGSMRIYLGNELFYSEGILDALDNHEALTINGSRYVLVEFRESESVNYIMNALRSLIDKGYIPIVAHVERYHEITTDIGYVEDIIKLGGYIQVNISTIGTKALDGVFDKSTAFARELLRNELIHFLGTDAHKDEGRIPDMSAVRYIDKKHGTGVSKILLNRNPARILADKII